ncbi:hypothetical protein E3P77_02693 [Wallemia ichthyophaga]|nr:hypothetical protein E3P77_02693 [Wallemia ichthyophaga]
MEFNGDLEYKLNNRKCPIKFQLSKAINVFPSTNSLDRVQTFNPYSRQLLNTSSRNGINLLISPTNENDQCLNINLINSLNNSSINLNSPILQISSSNSNTLSRSRYLGHLIAVKTRLGVIFYNSSNKHLDHIHTFTHTHPISDLSFKDLNCLLIDPYDNIFKFNFNPRLKSPASISQLRHHPYYHQSYDNRFRLIDFNPYDEAAEYSCLTANSHSLSVIDFRSSISTIIYQSPSTITHLLSSTASNIPLTALTTTDHILFFDIHNFSQSLLSIPHNRDYDRTLSIHTINGPHNTISVLLFSAIHPLLSIWTIGGTPSFPRSLHAPYAHKLPFPPIGGCAVHERGRQSEEHDREPTRHQTRQHTRNQSRRLSRASSRAPTPQHPPREHSQILQPSQPPTPSRQPTPHQNPDTLSQNTDAVYDMYLRSQGGSLSYATLFTADADADANAPPLDIRTDPAVWSQEVDGYFGDGLASMREYTLRDMTKQWGLISGGGSGGATLALRDKLPLQPFASAGLQVRLASEVEIGQREWDRNRSNDAHAAWSYSIPQSLLPPPPSFPYAGDAAGEIVQRQLQGAYNVCSNRRPHDVPAEGKSEGKRNFDGGVAVGDVGGVGAANTPTDATASTGGLVQELTRAASAMNIHNSTPVRPYTFGALRPMVTRRSQGDEALALARNDAIDATDADTKPPLNTATNLLLAEWSGSVDAYRYRDPYADSEEGEMGIEGQTQMQTDVPPPPSQKIMRRPPVVLSTAAPGAHATSASNAMNGSLTPAPQSQPQSHAHLHSPALTQPSQPPSQPNPSTQVEPGRFGGRPVATKKKKKRVGGF